LEVALVTLSQVQDDYFPYGIKFILKLFEKSFSGGIGDAPVRPFRTR
jgi:hypothetical protein